MARLSKEDWTQLDVLLGKAGFGGYYDLIECLRMIASNLSPEMGQKLQNEKDIHALVAVILSLSKQKQNAGAPT